MAAPGRIEFTRLTEVPILAVLALLNEPRNARHMPLAGAWSETSAAAWVQSKDAQWEESGYGPWAILFDGEFAGWGGFQREKNGPDFALVLLPAHWDPAARSRGRRWIAASTKCSSRYRSPGPRRGPSGASGSCQMAK